MDINDVRPMIVDLPYGKHEKEDFRAALVKRMQDLYGDGYSELDVALMQYLHYVLDYPTVYVVYSGKHNQHSGKPEYTAYVGETNNIIQRTVQHLETDPKTREDWKAIADAVAKDDDAFRQFVISHPWFNKSLTLDVENRMMHYLSSVESVKKLNNRRTNAQGSYYTSDQFDRIFSQIWLDLHDDDPKLFPTEEIIRDSALFKASPFHKLSDDQVQAENSILTQLAVLLAAKAKTAPATEAVSTESPESAVSAESAKETVPAKTEDNPKLIFVQGAAGTGKTVLLSHMFYRIATELGTQESDASDDEDRLQWPDLIGSSNQPSYAGKKLSSYILVNHKEQVHVYNQIATKLGLQKEAGDIVMLPTQFINRFSEKKVGKNTADLEKISGKADIVLIDEAHLLMTQGNQGYSGKNQLYDILRRARIVIAVFDPDQILQARQQWNPETLAKLFPNNQLAAHDTKTAGKIGGFETVTIGPAEDLDPLAVDVAHIHLEQQFRIAASDAVVKWVDDFTSGRGLSKLPEDKGEYDSSGKQTRAPYEIKVFDSPVELYKAIRKKSELKSDGWNGVGLSRLLATYDWHYSSQKSNPNDARGLWNVELHKNPETGVWETKLAKGDHGNGFETVESSFVGPDPDRFCLPWNYELRADRKDLPKRPKKASADPKSSKRREKDVDAERAWAEQSHTINEVGSTFTIQGFDLNYAGVIIGPSVKYRDGRIVFDPDASENSLATNKRGDLDRFLESGPYAVNGAHTAETLDADSREGKKARAKRLEALQKELAMTNLRNELNVLLKRGVHGLYLFAVDPELQQKLKECVQ
ncbi:DUF2075 domain-containing protein [Bifidobacterium callimiconis]|uniref:DUF2075 domain-containing protein n=1 Tax=Bifidobacterium callimiconis TaxID=2306973 RepID=UPI001BDDC319|nr:DUF2075 domain-containing protein [Bifidobacterium callimiconis]MBT1176516.1 DUF2075 domain-containing protein [Bifidobacterium callimiconis]